MRIYIAIVFVSILTTSCSVYRTNVAYSPLFTNKGEIQAGACGSGSGFDYQLAYAITNHIGIYGAQSIQKAATKVYMSDSIFHGHNYKEIALGYYSRKDLTKRFEVFGGLGNGTMKGMLTSPSMISGMPARIDYRMDGKANYYFIQTTVGNTKKKSDKGFICRLEYVKLADDFTKTNMLLLRPAFFNRFGGKNFKITTSLGFCLPVYSNVSKEIYSTYYPYFNFSMGIQLFLKKYSL